MSLALPENFLFVPGPGGQAQGHLYELEEAKAYEKKSFVIIPYGNPQVQKPSPAFYRVLSKRPLDLSTLVNEKPQVPLVLKMDLDKESYIRHVGKLLQHIQRGDIYEINYCIRFSAADAEIDPLSVFIKLHRLSAAPYAALVKLKDDHILCASPELFLEKKGRQLFSKPIKGTSPRGASAEEDQALKVQLQNSLKERTEHVMAVDVARNDLSQLATKGSVQVDLLYNIESFETVHQMVSTVRCELKEGLSFGQILEATFPMASMTGAPKLRAMQLAGEHESFRRHHYSGAMGLVDENGDFCLSVLIRSIFYNSAFRTLSLAVGGAITYLSDPEKEYEECLLKASALLKALGAEIEP